MQLCSEQLHACFSYHLFCKYFITLLMDLVYFLLLVLSKVAEPFSILFSKKFRILALHVRAWPCN